MSSYAATARRLEADRRKDEREARQRQKLLEKKLKEIEKVGQLERDRLEVEQYENELDILLSIQKECSANFDWKSLAYSLPPHPPNRTFRHELRVTLENSATRNTDDSLLKEGQSSRIR